MKIVISLCLLLFCISIVFPQEVSSPPSAIIPEIITLGEILSGVEVNDDVRTTLPTVTLRSLEELQSLSEINAHNLRVKKATRIVETFAAYRNSNGQPSRSSFLPYIETFITYCEDIAKRKNAPGFESTWYWALVYGYANFGLTCYGVAPGNCAGPFDVKHYPLVLDPVANMKHHMNEQYLGWARGYRGIGLCKYVMLPSNPRDWGGGQFRKTNNKFQACIQRGYEVGKLP